MRKSRFTETRVGSILKEAECGLSVREACRKHRIMLGQPVHVEGEEWRAVRVQI